MPQPFAVALAALAAVACGFTLTGDGGRIAFAVGAGGIAMVNGDGSGDFEHLRVDDVVSPAWSPDGKRIAYTGFKGLWVINRDGSTRRRLVRWDGIAVLRAAWSPDGNWIAYDEPFGVRIVSTRGGHPRSVGRYADRDPSWSRDGKRLVFAAYERAGPVRAGEERKVVGELSVMDVDGGGRRRLTKNLASGDAGHPSWSPDGKAIVFDRTQFVRGPGPTYIERFIHHIHLVNANGTGERRLTSGSDPSWSPDGRRVVFSRDEPKGAKTRIWTMRIDGSEQRQVWPPSGACHCGNPTWGP